MTFDIVHSDPARGRIAVLIPVYNERGALAPTLRSLCGQGVPFTAVLVDDGSTPALTVNTAGLDYPVVVLRLPENRGIERALNAGLDYIAAQAFEFVARLDSGDRCAPTRLMRQQLFLDGHPDVHLVGSNVEWRRDDGTYVFTLSLPTDHDAIMRAMPETTCVIHPTVMLRASVVAAVGQYSTTHPAAEDLEFFWRVARRFRMANIPETLLVTRFDEQGLSRRRRSRQLLSTLRIRIHNFDASRREAYAGVIKVLMLLAVPYPLVVWLKRQRHQPARIGAAGQGMSTESA